MLKRNISWLRILALLLAGVALSPAQSSSYLAVPATPSANNAAPVNISPIVQLATPFHAQASLKAAAASAGAPAKSDSMEEQQALHVVVGRSLFLNTPERLRRIYISNPNVLTSVTPSPNELVISAKAAGTSSLAIWSESGRSTQYTVLADIDVAGLADSLKHALPGSHVEVQSQQGRVVLSGYVGSDAEAEMAAKLAGSYSKEVINSILVDPRHRAQVELKVRIAEVDRTKLDQWGFNFLSVGKNTGASTTGQYGTPSFPQIGGGNGTKALLSDILNLFYFNQDLNLGVLIKDLQGKGILEVLAEPNLTTIDGQTARFLAGGEFPYPVIQPGGGGGTASVTIQFMPYGVRLDFTPYVHPDGSVRVRVAPEVSALDYSNVTQIAGYTIPSISTRKAETEIELKDGQSFGISGLLDHRTTDNLSRIPGIAAIPVLGQLFRSKNINHSVTELIVIVTPTVVNPISAPSEPPKDPHWLAPPGYMPDFTRGLPKEYQPDDKKQPATDGAGGNHN